MQAAGRGLERLRTALTNAEDAVARSSDGADGGLGEAAARARRAFESAMDDDFNTPQALAVLFTLAGEINKVAAAVATRSGEGRAGLWAATDVLRELARVLGLALPRAGVEPSLLPELKGLLEEARREAADLFPDAGDGNAEEVIQALLAGRQRAREQRNYVLADRVRARLGELGIIVEDLPGGARWRPAPRAGEPRRFR